MKWIFPACFYPTENGQYSVIFPDLDEATAFANSLDEALDIAIDLLGGCLLTSIANGEEIPKPSPITTISPDYPMGFTSLIAVDLTEYENLYGNQSVKKTLTIPAWMNTLAEKSELNFSGILQDGLLEALHLND